MDRQLTELLTNYGAIGGIWFNGMWDKPDADWQLRRTHALIHQLQPAALIVPNHHQAPKPGQDVQTFEQDLPGANTAGFNTTTSGTLPLETSLTMNDSWGFNTRGGPIPPRPWGVTTQRVDTVFVHVLDWPDRALAIPWLGRRVVSASMLGTGERVAVAQADSAITLTMPASDADAPDRVVVLSTTPGHP